MLEIKRKKKPSTMWEIRWTMRLLIAQLEIIIKVNQKKILLKGRKKILLVFMSTPTVSVTIPEAFFLELFARAKL